MTTTLHLIRHAEADVDSFRYANHLTMGLSVVGCGQAAEAALRLSKVAQVAGPIISSPLARAQQTAAQIAAYAGFEMTTDERLAERTFPYFYGMKYSEIANQHGPELAHALQTNSDLIDGYGALSLSQCYEAVRGLLRELASNASADVCLVTHGGPLGWMLSVLLEPLAAPLAWKFRFDHVGYSRIVVDNSARLLKVEWLNRQLTGAT